MRPESIAVIFTVALFCAGCPSGNNEKSDSATPLPVVPIKPVDSAAAHSNKAGFSVRYFNDSADAVAWVLDAKKPLAIGFGEYHQTEGTVSIRSAISRFTEEIMPILAAISRDIVLETWILKGCGEVEEKVIKEVDEVSQRPAETENETIRLIRISKKLGISPHILDVTCDEYAKVFLPDGVDFYLLLEMVGRLLKAEGLRALARPLDGKNGNEKKADKQMRELLIVFGGAIHNDIHPAQDWKDVSFGPAVSAAVKGRYVEVDLLVPEFVSVSTVAKKEPWFDTFTNAASEKEVALITLSPQSYLIVFKKGVRTP